MIDREELLRDIVGCQKEPVTLSSIEKLACLYIVYDHLYGGTDSTGCSEDTDDKIHVIGDSDFLNAVRGKSQSDVFKVLDELMDVIHAINVRLYDQVLARIK